MPECAVFDVGQFNANLASLIERSRQGMSMAGAKTTFSGAIPPDGSRHPWELRAGDALGAGVATILGPDIIHSVANPLAGTGGAVHVYDGDFLHVEHSI